MKKLILFASALLFSEMISAQVATWTKKTDFPVANRRGAIAFSIGDRGYVGTGYDETAGAMKDFWEYNPTNNTWRQRADVGASGDERYYAVGFSIGNNGYAALGAGPSGNRTDMMEYDTTANTWTAKTDFGGTSRAYAACFVIGNRAYVGCGIGSGASYKNDFWVWNQANDTWTQKTNYAGTGRGGNAAFAIGTAGYMGLGFDGTSSKTDLFQYDTTANTWTAKTSLPGNGRNAAVVFMLGTKAYIAGGYKQGTGGLSDTWEYNTATDTWTSRTAFAGGARYNASGFSVGTKGYAVAGFNSSVYYEDLYEFAISNVAPTVTTTSASSITNTTASSGGNATNDGGASITAKGVCWNTTGTPTTSDFTTSDGTGTGSFVSSLTGLTQNTTYYVRAYATNSVGTSYGSQTSFTTLNVGINEINNAAAVSVFPNPVQEFIQITISDAKKANDKWQFELFDLLGKRIFSKQIIGNERIKRDELPSGTYFYKIQNTNSKENHSGKLVFL